MDNDLLVSYLKQKGRSKPAIERTLNALAQFTDWLNTQHKTLPQRNSAHGDELTLEDLQAFIATRPKQQKNILMGLVNVFDYLDLPSLKTYAVELREALLDNERSSMPLRDFIGLPDTLLQKLEASGIKNALQLVKACPTPASRRTLASQLDVDYKDLLDLVKMADLSRLFAVKAVRARLYLDSGFDTLDKLAAQEPMDLHQALVKFVDETHFDGIATLPKEAIGTITAAKELERLVIFEARE